MRHCEGVDCVKIAVYLCCIITKTITILTLRNAVLASVADARYVFSKVNDFLTEAGKPPLFTIQLVGLTKEVRLHGGLFLMQPDFVIDDAPPPDLIIIPSLPGNMMSSTHMNIDYGHWIARQYKRGAEVASLCTGAFLLAYTGLLKGKQCTTHWQYANELAHFYPTIEVVDEKVITDQSGLYSSGGNNAYWNLLLHLVEKYTDREMAIRTAKYFVIDLDRNNQSPFIIFQGQKDHEDEAVKKVQEYIENTYQEKYTVDFLADMFNMSRRTFERRFKKATRNTVVEYIQRVKIEAAKKQLEIGRKSIAEIMLDVGYYDIQAFREVFKRIAGMTPNDYRNKYNNG